MRLAVYIADASKVSLITALWHRMDAHTKLIVKNVDTYFPEIVDRAIIMNCPSVACEAFRLCSLFMDPVTLAKVVMRAGLPRDELVDMIGFDNLPREFGGGLRYALPHVSTALR